jgi:hypothetical protein
MLTLDEVAEHWRLRPAAVRIGSGSEIFAP